MPLWRVTCPTEERYVVATTLDEAMKIAIKNWPKSDGKTANVYEVVRAEQVTRNDPWVK